MPPVAARDITVILLDLKARRTASALHAFTEVLLYEQLSNSKNFYQIYLVNVAKPLSENNSNYKGIMRFNADNNIKALLEEIMSLETGEANFIESLAVGVRSLEEWFESRGVVTLRLLFITDLSSFDVKSYDSQLMDDMVKKITWCDIFLYIIGPSLNPPQIITSDKDVKKWMANFQPPHGNATLSFVKTLSQSIEHLVVCTYSVGVNLFNSFKYNKDTQPWRVPLSFGSILHLPASTMRLSKREPPFALKNSGSRRFADKWIIEEEQDKEVDISDVVKGVVKHGKFIKIETDGRFKVEGTRSFQVLLITETKNVPEYYLQSDGSYFVLPEIDEEQSNLKFVSELVDQLIKLNLCIIAKRVFNKDFNPKFVALLPHSQFSIKGFILCALPYADDIAHTYKEQDLKSAPKVDVNKNIYDFLDSIDVNEEKCKIKVPLGPPMMMYSTGFNIIDKVKEKLIGDCLDRKPDVSDVITANLDLITKNWPERQEVQKEEVKKDEIDFSDVSDFNFD